jgi:hypothetical protein
MFCQYTAGADRGGRVMKKSEGRLVNRPCKVLENRAQLVQFSKFIEEEVRLVPQVSFFVTRIEFSYQHQHERSGPVFF